MSGGAFDDGVEFGERGATRETFPAAWGRPPGSSHSEERQRWVLSSVHRFAASTYYRVLARREARLFALARRADLDRRNR